jgi:hypothetical protein
VVGLAWPEGPVMARRTGTMKFMDGFGPRGMTIECVLSAVNEW